MLDHNSHTWDFWEKQHEFIILHLGLYAANIVHNICIDSKVFLANEAYSISWCNNIRGGRFLLVKIRIDFFFQTLIPLFIITLLPPTQ